MDEKPLTNAERQARFRERKRLEQEEREREEHAALEVKEELLREEFGYSDSESRSEAERDAAAARMLAAQPTGVPVVPADIREVWGDSTFPAQAIAAWGLEAFRGSAIHRQALDERRRADQKREVREAFVKANASMRASRS